MTAAPPLAGPRAPSVLYVSYDGAAEPLGRSQVVAYLLRLARDCDVTLISFEKDAWPDAQLASLLGQAGIRWRPLRYHARPAVLSSVYDILAGAWAVRRESRRRRADVVHVRSYVPAAMALISGGTRSARLLFDIRGFWVDERVAGGMWRSGGLLHRLGKRCERWLFDRADAVVTLTHASVPQIRAWLGRRKVPVRVIPTCADVARFAAAAPRPDGPRAVWSGSVGSFYRFDLAVDLAHAMELPLTVLTRQVEDAAAILGGRSAEVRTVAHDAIADELHPGDVGLCLYAGGPADTARAPTRFAEYLAAGMVVAVTPGVGDLEALVRRHAVGAVVEGDGEPSLRAAGRALLALAGDPAAQDRSRALAAHAYTVEAGAREYLALYRELAPAGPALPAAREMGPAANGHDSTVPRS